MKNMLLRTGLACLGLVVVSCANFRNLGRELKMVGAGYTVVVRLDGMAAERGPVPGVVVEWDRAAGRIVSWDVIDVGESGLLAFVVERPENIHVTLGGAEEK